MISVPESPPLGLHDTVSVQLHRLLHVKCCTFLIFNWTEVVRLKTKIKQESIMRSAFFDLSLPTEVVSFFVYFRSFAVYVSGVV